MKYLDFYKRLDLMEDKEYIENFLVYNSSLVIAGVKPAVTINLKKSNEKMYFGWNDFGKKFIKNINLKFIELRENNDCMIIMIYDENILEKELNKKSHIDFLANIGYPSQIKIDRYIDTLKFRYNKYHCPHELGLFLGIPFEDVKDFMECTTKKCLLCGYWKVYNDSKKAKMIFNTYDTVKEYTINNMLEGSLSRDLALSIKNSFYKNALYI
ncbi:DUF3793 family protein [Clostridium beijerinckii]|uniref:DUF3793 family protein n=1 Tax=Clostridium beijerinckii TaxID=1520 RepID=UPI00098C2462|nr:DUF3793 family protein [Clostridium beijerinckii]NRT75920.1 hypothetical protein [Clostridium beijerinckii]OOM48313.1 hypothetical protein CBEIJ_24120 [Clostridium beijerinckii]